MTAPPPLPLSFRQELAPHVFKAIAGGWSCALVGLPGLGLSNFLRFLVTPRVAEHYLGADSGQSLLVFVEGDRLLEPAALFTGLARQVLAAAHAQGWARAEQAALRRLAEAPSGGALAQPAEPLAGLAQHVCGDLERRLVLVCDEFDAALANLPGASLRELRALRDAHKYRLTLVAGLRREADVTARARQDDPAGGAAKLAELFEEHTFPLRPYGPEDCRLAIERKTVGWATAPSEEQVAGLCRLTGGHAKLLMGSLVLLEPRRHLPWPNVERGLLADAALGETCRGVWQALEPAEQRALWRLARDEREAIPEGGLERLALLGLAVGGPAQVFSSLMEAFVLAQPEPPAPAGPPAVWHRRDPNAAPKW